MFGKFVLYVVIGLVAIVIEAAMTLKHIYDKHGIDGLEMMEEVLGDERFPSVCCRSVWMYVLEGIWGVIIWPIRLIKAQWLSDLMCNLVDEYMEAKNNEEVSEED